MKKTYQKPHLEFETMMMQESMLQASLPGGSAASGEGTIDDTRAYKGGFGVDWDD